MPVYIIVACIVIKQLGFVTIEEEFSEKNGL